ncbi:MAG: hypothetical protein QMD11_01530, partial [Smithella sp.]|nr:hypothetical protein [Smithella sp.]
MSKRAFVMMTAIICISLVSMWWAASNTHLDRADDQAKLAPLAPPNLQPRVTVVESKPARRA